MKPTPDDAPGFAPDDPDDNRAPGDWRTRYPKEAKRWIRVEFAFLLLWIVAWSFVASRQWSEYDPDELDTPSILYLSFSGGALGGALFSLKWLYHSVAKQLWNVDRMIWRYSTPVVSGVLAGVVITLGVSGLVPLLDTEELSQRPAILGVSFLVGYFSDNALAALAVIASNVLGPRE